MADASKDNRSSLSESCALYYFPEIPCDEVKERAPSPEPECFVGMGLGNDHDGSASPGNLEDSEEVRQLVEEAFAKGQEKGRAEVAAANREKIEQAVAALKAAIEEMEKNRCRDRERMEIETVRLALAIAKKIVRYETEHGDVIEKVVKAAMQQVADPRKLRVRLNPRDIEAVAALGDQLQNGEDADAQLALEGDEAVGRGGCVIEARLGDVDARIEQQIKVIEEMLNDRLPKPIAEG
ncbi:FliH/SctL family protein [uncultured Desulfosarcina sp.]|uniref:FliH/SctL family protein n=1 Tax=uncultured Desulfosarcina sp. TaxID=218289 RepID=UPI0029C95FD7|nr:FliH/SctL family protein [uncultured Desulfosarcina sp.]